MTTPPPNSSTSVKVCISPPRFVATSSSPTFIVTLVGSEVPGPDRVVPPELFEERVEPDTTRPRARAFTERGIERLGVARVEQGDHVLRRTFHGELRRPGHHSSWRVLQSGRADRLRSVLASHDDNRGSDESDERTRAKRHDGFSFALRESKHEAPHRHAFPAISRFERKSRAVRFTFVFRTLPIV